MQHSLTAETVEKRLQNLPPSDTAPSATTRGGLSEGGEGETGDLTDGRLLGEGREEGESITQDGDVFVGEEGKGGGEEKGREEGVSARVDGDVRRAGPIPVAEGEVPVVTSGNGSPGHRSDTPTVCIAKEEPVGRESPTQRETEDPGTPSSSSSPSSRTSSPRRRHKKSRPSPLVPPTAPDVAGTPSTESPTSRSSFPVTHS